MWGQGRHRDGRQREPPQLLCADASLTPSLETM